MAITYKKQLKSIEITTIGGGTFSVEDTADCAAASAALAQFESGMTMVFTITEDDEEMTVEVPFHAVDHIVITVAESEDIERPDPVCPEEGE